MKEIKELDDLKVRMYNYIDNWERRSYWFMIKEFDRTGVHILEKAINEWSRYEHNRLSEEIFKEN